MFTDAELANLITCSKQVVDPPRREMRVEGKMKRNDMTLKSVDGTHSFRAFIRQSELFSENFSFGLIYLPGDEPGSFQLIRCNGQHGGEKAHPHHAVFHIHRSRADDINTGILEPQHIEQTVGYASFREGLVYFCNTINLERADDYFPGFNQGVLNFPTEEAGSNRRLDLEL